MLGTARARHRSQGHQAGECARDEHGGVQAHRHGCRDGSAKWRQLQSRCGHAGSSVRTTGELCDARHHKSSSEPARCSAGKSPGVGAQRTGPVRLVFRRHHTSSRRSTGAQLGGTIEEAEPRAFSLRLRPSHVAPGDGGNGRGAGDTLRLLRARRWRWPWLGPVLPPRLPTQQPSARPSGVPYGTPPSLRVASMSLFNLSANYIYDKTLIR
mmetsp:Transcript_10956/g.29178  ORF Transcript_10956/g.29178 Transcript_10956/m.29178 type:complete len:211 (-) Transcript_10956:11-643(-)